MSNGTDIAGFAPGGPYANGAAGLVYAPSMMLVLPNQLTGNSIACQTAPTADAPIHLLKNVSVIATGTIKAGEFAGAFGSIGADATLVFGDSMSVIFPNPADSTLGGVSFTIPTIIGT